MAGMRGTIADVLRRVGQAFPLLETLDAAYCRDLNDECFRAFVEWPNTTTTPESIPVFDHIRNWTRFGNGIELTSREAGFDHGDPTKYWRRVTSLRHLSVSGCKHITDLTCSALAFSVPKLEFLEMAGIGGNVHDDGLIRLFKTTPRIRKIDLEDAADITDALLDCLIPEARTPTASSGRMVLEIPQPGEMLEHLTISYAILITPEAMTRFIRGCKKLRVFEADNTRLTSSVLREFVSRRRHREKGVVLHDGEGSEIVGIDCRGVSENSVKDLKASTRPRRGWRGWEARDLGYEDGLSVGVTDLTTGLVGGALFGQDECDEKRVVVKTFHSWVAVDTVAEQRAKLKSSREHGAAKNADTPRWLTTWSLGRRSPAQSTIGTPEEREDRGCIVQ
jgi:F-box/leucine-rich repeat protein 2/20